METSQRLLIVADWTVDPQSVVAAVARRTEQNVSLALVVPAWLHGLDWAGDPYASVPCARRALETLANQLSHAGLHVHSAEVGDPDPTAAIGDALLDQPVDKVMIFAHRTRLGSHPLNLAHRIARATSLPVEQLAVARPSRRLHLRRRGHCSITEPLAA
jgi:hypothetical protein